MFVITIRPIFIRAARNLTNFTNLRMNVCLIVLTATKAVAAKVLGHVFIVNTVRVVTNQVNAVVTDVIEFCSTSA